MQHKIANACASAHAVQRIRSATHLTIAGDRLQGLHHLDVLPAVLDLLLVEICKQADMTVTSLFLHQIVRLVRRRTHSLSCSAPVQMVFPCAETAMQKCPYL